MGDDLDGGVAGPTPSDARSDGALSAAQKLALALVLLAAAALRFHGLELESFWVDEASSLQTASGRGLAHRRLPVGVVLEPAPRLTDLEGAAPVWSVWFSMVDDNHTPLYFMILRVWLELLGQGDLAARSLSAVAGLLAVAAVFEVGRLWQGTAAGLWAAAIMALSAPQVRYAQEARMYALLTAFTLAAAVAVLRIARRGPGWWRAASALAASLCALLTHYYALGPILALAVWAFLDLRGARRRQACGAVIAALAIYASSWGPVLWMQRGRIDKNPWFVEAGDGHLSATAGRLASLPLNLLVAPDRRPLPASQWAVALYALPFVVGRRRRAGLLWGLWIAAGVAQVAALDMARSMALLANIRFTLVVGAAFYLLLGAVRLGTRPFARHAVPAAALLICALGLTSADETGSVDKPQWRDMAGLLRDAVGPGEALVFTKEGYTVAGAYHCVARYYDPGDRPVVLLEAPASSAVIARLRRAPAIWVVGGSRPPEWFLPGIVVENRVEWPTLGNVWQVRLGSGAEGDLEGRRAQRARGHGGG